MDHLLPKNDDPRFELRGPVGSGYDRRAPSGEQGLDATEFKGPTWLPLSVHRGNGGGPERVSRGNVHLAEGKNLLSRRSLGRNLCGEGGMSEWLGRTLSLNHETPTREGPRNSNGASRMDHPVSVTEGPVWVTDYPVWVTRTPRLGYGHAPFGLRLLPVWVTRMPRLGYGKRR